MIRKRTILVFIFMIVPFTCFSQGIDANLIKKLQQSVARTPSQQKLLEDSLRKETETSKSIAVKVEELSTIEEMFKEKYLMTPRRIELELLIDSLVEEVKSESLKIERSKYLLELKSQAMELTSSDTIYLSDTMYFHLRKKLSKTNKQLSPLSVTLKQFGYDIFQTSLKEIPTFAPVADNYILGPGDELYIDISGELNNSWTVTINRDGSIVLPHVGNINLWGKSYGEGRKIIGEEFRKEFSNIEVNLSLGHLKSVSVFVLGEVNKPGVYNITVLSNPLAPLFEADGPKKSGSLRKIKYISNNGTTKTIDLYKLLIKENPLPSIQFSSGDILFVPPIDKVVGIRGAVNRPGIYEIENDERLSELTEMAGGLLPTAGKKRIQLERISPENEKIVKDLKFEDENDFNRISKNITIENGDLAGVFEIPPYLHNYVEINGNVKNQGIFGLKDGMTVLDLINEAGGIRKGTYMERADLFRFVGVTHPQIIEINLKKLLEGAPEENFNLEEWDRIKIFSNEELEEKFYVEISGEVEKPDSFPLYPQMKVKDLVFSARPKISAQKGAELFRVDPDKGAYVRNIDIENDDDLKIILQPRDYILIKRIPSYSKVGTVNLKGEFTFPGNYQIKVGTSLKEVIDRAGGFTKNAYLEGAMFVRTSVANAQNQATEDLTRETTMRLLYEQRALMRSMQSESDKIADMEYIRIQQQQLSQIKGIQNPGRVVIDLSNPEQLNIPLEDSDTIYVPLTPKTVQIIGEVYNPTGITYEERLSLKDYLAMAGGPKPSADKKEIYIRRASGKVEKGTSKIKPGDTIIIPVKVAMGISFWQVLGNTVDILYKVALAVLAFNAVTSN